MRTKTRTFLCQVRNCPMERTDVSEDDKETHREAMRKTFGDEWNMVNCKTVFSDNRTPLFCEMLVTTTHTPVQKYLPNGTRLVMEVDNV